MSVAVWAFDCYTAAMRKFWWKHICHSRRGRVCDHTFVLTMYMFVTRQSNISKHSGILQHTGCWDVLETNGNSYFNAYTMVDTAMVGPLQHCLQGLQLYVNQAWIGTQIVSLFFIFAVVDKGPKFYFPIQLSREANRRNLLTDSFTESLTKNYLYISFVRN